MKKPTRILSIGLIALFAVSGCGGDDSQEEAIREMEETFALESSQDSSAEPQESPTSGGGTSSQPRTTNRDTSSQAQRTSSQSGGNSSGSGGLQEGGERQVDPVVQEAARQTVQLMRSRQYDTAVENLDRLMRSPDLTPAQRSATRRTMVEIQQQIARDPSITEAERDRVRQVLDRQ